MSEEVIRLRWFIARHQVDGQPPRHSGNPARDYWFAKFCQATDAITDLYAEVA